MGNTYILLLHNYTKAMLEFWGLLFGYNYSTSSFCSLWLTAFLQTQLSNVTVEVHRSVIKTKVNICVVAVPSCLEREHRFPPLNWGHDTRILSRAPVVLGHMISLAFTSQALNLYHHVSFFFANVAEGNLVVLNMAAVLSERRNDNYLMCRWLMHARRSTCPGASVNLSSSNGLFIGIPVLQLAL